jgi:hypothetical protein
MTCLVDRPRAARRETPLRRRGVPRWVKILAGVGGAILIGVGIALASGHGPGRHAARGADGPAAHSGPAVAGDPPGARRI